MGNANSTDGQFLGRGNVPSQDYIERDYDTEVETLQDYTDNEETLIDYTENEEESQLHTDAEDFEERSRWTKMKKAVEKVGELPPYPRGSRLKSPTGSAIRKVKSKSPVTFDRNKRFFPRNHSSSRESASGDGSVTDGNDYSYTDNSYTTRGTGASSYFQRSRQTEADERTQTDDDGSYIVRRPSHKIKHQKEYQSSSETSVSGAEDAMLVEADEEYTKSIPSRSLPLICDEDDNNTIVDGESVVGSTSIQGSLNSGGYRFVETTQYRKMMTTAVPAKDVIQIHENDGVPVVEIERCASSSWTDKVLGDGTIATSMVSKHQTILAASGTENGTELVVVPAVDIGAQRKKRSTKGKGKSAETVTTEKSQGRAKVTPEKKSVIGPDASPSTDFLYSNPTFESLKRHSRDPPTRSSRDPPMTSKVSNSRLRNVPSGSGLDNTKAMDPKETRTKSEASLLDFRHGRAPPKPESKLTKKTRRNIPVVPAETPKHSVQEAKAIVTVQAEAPKRPEQDIDRVQYKGPDQRNEADRRWSNSKQNNNKNLITVQAESPKHVAGFAVEKSLSQVTRDRNERIITVQAETPQNSNIVDIREAKIPSVTEGSLDRMKEQNNILAENAVAPRQIDPPEKRSFPTRGIHSKDSVSTKQQSNIDPNGDTVGSNNVVPISEKASQAHGTLSGVHNSRKKKDHDLDGHAINDLEKLRLEKKDQLTTQGISSECAITRSEIPPRSKTDPTISSKDVAISESNEINAARSKQPVVVGAPSQEKVPRTSNDDQEADTHPENNIEVLKSSARRQQPQRDCEDSKAEKIGKKSIDAVPPAKQRNEVAKTAMPSDSREPCAPELGNYPDVDPAELRDEVSVTSEEFEGIDLEAVEKFEITFNLFLAKYPELAKKNTRMVETLRVAKLQKLLSVMGALEGSIGNLVEERKRQKAASIKHYQNQLAAASESKAAREMHLQRSLEEAQKATRTFGPKMIWQFITRCKSRVKKQADLQTKLAQHKARADDPLSILPADRFMMMRTVLQLEVVTPSSSGLSKEQIHQLRKLQVENAFLKSEISVLVKKLAYQESHLQKHAWVDSVLRRIDSKREKMLKDRYQGKVGAAFL